jgi:hypothetical protein
MCYGFQISAPDNSAPSDDSPVMQRRAAAKPMTAELCSSRARGENFAIQLAGCHAFAEPEVTITLCAEREVKMDGTTDRIVQL